VKKQRVLIAFAACIVLLSAISPSLVAAKTILTEERAIKTAIQTHEKEKKVKTVVKPSKIETNCYTDNADAAIIFPKSSDDPIIIRDLEVQENSCSIDLPPSFQHDGKRASRDLLLYGSKQGTKLGLQSTEGGFRALVQIMSSCASHDYPFTFQLNKGQRLAYAADYLGKEFDTGEVYVVNAQNKIISIVSSAWARDAFGKKVSTSYIVKDNQLIQHIDFDEHSAFPIVADPDWWKITQCAGALA